MKFLAERTQTIVDADDTPIDDTPVDDTPADDTPADDTPADDTPATDVPEDTEIVIDIQDISGNDT
jgi:hypothetical protein